MSKLFTLLLVLLVWQSTFAQNCPITLSAGPDIALCAPGGSTTLQGSLTGPYLSYSWSPTTGLTNPNSLTPTAIVTTTTTYTLSASAMDTFTNLVFNGDFQMGNVGFTSDHTYNPTELYLPGTYAVVESPTVVNSNFPPCDDHSPGTGNMMIINGSTTPNQNVWCQTINVTPNTNYVFGGWIGTMVPFSLAQLTVFVNGTQVGGPYSGISTPCSWTPFETPFNSGAASTITICIRNQNTANLGNDFALDDLFLYGVCTESDQVTVSVVPIAATALPVQVLPCASGTLQINASGSSTGAGYSYLWTTGNGNIVSGANTLSPTVDAAGAYTLTVTYSAPGITCTATTTVQVFNDPATPFAFANSSGNLNCLQTSVNLIGAGSTGGTGVSYLWTTSNGNITGPATALNTTANAAGTYQLLVTTPAGCTQTASVTIIEDTTPPTATAEPNAWITCSEPEPSLNGQGSSTGPSFNYLWTSSDGLLLSGETSLSPAVGLPGTYTLQVSNAANGCTAETEVLVSADTLPPTAHIALAEPFDCSQTELTLSAASGPNLLYSWTSANGTMLGNTNLDSLQIGSAGTYVLTVTNPNNGCTNTDSLLVGDLSIPVANAGANQEIDCAQPSINLDGSASGPGSISWTTSTGNIVSGADSPTPLVNAPGWYLLQIINVANGCIGLDSVEVSSLDELPTLIIQTPGPLTCTQLSALLDASGSDTGPNFTHLWQTSDGTLGPIVDQLQAEALAPGVYSLTTTNLDNGCQSSASVEVLQDTLHPQALAASPETITCLQASLWLDASASVLPPGTSVAWSSASGLLLSAPDSLALHIGAAGDYQLLLENTGNGCTDSLSLTVMADTTQPTLQINGAALLTCALTELTLSATADGNGAPLSYAWSSPDAPIAGDPQQPELLLNTPGTYQVLVINTENGCETLASVTIDADQQTPFADAGSAQVLNCLQAQLSLQGSASPGLQYTWSTANGNLLSGTETLEPEVDAPGTYWLSVLNPATGCEQTDSVLVSADFALPTAEAGAPQTLSCSQTELQLDGTGSSVGFEYSYLWSTPDGVIQSGITSLSPTISAAGSYELLVTNTSNGCSSSALVQIDQDADLPVVSIAATAALSCLQPEVLLDGSASSSGPSFAYLWTTTDGNLPGNTENPQATANQAGTYLLQITNTLNNCSTSASVQVGGSLEPAQAALSASNTLLTCIETSQTLDGTGSSAGMNPVFQWSGPGVAGSSTDVLTVAQPGVYTLIVSNPESLCADTATLTILQDVAAPQLSIAPAAELNCLVSSFQLEATALTGSGGVPDVLWISTNGNLVSGETTLTPLIDAAGTYLLTATDPQNGCTASASVSVGVDVEPPIAQASASGQITCAQSSVPLLGNGSSQGAGFTYIWSTSNGLLGGNPAALNASALGAGTYQLLVTNAANGCTEAASVSVSADTEPPLVSAGSTFEFPCNAVQASLSGTVSGATNFSVQWGSSNGSLLQGSNTLTPTIGSGGLYTLQVENLANGCTAQASVSIGSSPALALDWQATHPACAGETGTLNVLATEGGSPPYLFALGGGALDAQSTWTELPSGYYTLVVEDALGCNLSTTVQIQAPPPLLLSIAQPAPINIGAALLLQPQTNLLPSEIASVLWSPSLGLDCDTCLRTLAQPLQTTEYQLLLETVNGCQTELRVLLEVNPITEIYAPNVFSPNNDGFNDYFTLFGAEGSIVQIRELFIFDRWGGAVFQGRGLSPGDEGRGWDGTHRGRPASTGVYTWHATLERIDGQIVFMRGDVLLLR
jgi:gliding motility-associated-like protein